MERVYYIDAEAFLRMMVEKALKAQGVECHTAEHTLDGLYIIKDLSPDLVVFDLLTDFEGHRPFIEELLSDAQIPVGAVCFEDKMSIAQRDFCEQNKIPLLKKPLSSQTLIQDFEALRNRFLELRDGEALS